jgi:hypothetical protein
MRNITDSGLRSSVCAGFTVVLTALLAWTFDLYTPYVRTSTADTSASQQVVASASAYERDTGGA